MAHTRNAASKIKKKDYHVAADITGQADHLGVTIQADIIKQKMPENNGGFQAINFSKWHPNMYNTLAGEHPINLCRYQVANRYMGGAGLIKSGGESKGASDLADALKTAVVNKRADVMGRRAFQRPLEEGMGLFQAMLDVYLDKQITIA